MAADFGRRFGELIQEADQIEAKKEHLRGELAGMGFHVDPNSLLGWQVKARQLLTSICGKDSHQLASFVENEKGGMYVTNHEILQKLRAILLAAKEDYEGGYLNTIRNLIHAEVFDDELEQAEQLLSAGYHGAAAVVAGVVLETTLRQMCEDNQIAVGKLDKMNADLAKAGVLNRLLQKQITTWADVRNSAAHGKTEQFCREDVSAMIRDVRRFVAERLS